ncbi:MAG: LapA family protein [Peptococcaceae bacterium]|nr:LapA family protein [Peptococcaceae bacterium]
MPWYLFIAFIFILGFTTFAIQNAQQITLHFLGWQIASFPLVMLLVFSVLLGAGTTLLFSLPKQIKIAGRNREANDRILQLEKELVLAKANKNQ